MLSKFNNEVDISTNLHFQWLDKFTDYKTNTYGFRFQEIKQNKVATIHTIGYEERSSQDYYWDGNKRDDVETYIFQYTLSGKGTFEINNTEYEMLAGKAFFVDIPSNNRYFLPEDSDKWEFIFITLSGQEAKDCWKFINQEHGYVFDIPSDSSLIQQLILSHKDTTEGKIDDPYVASRKAYEFIMDCYSYFKKKRIKTEKELPDNIKQALIYMQTQYHRPLTLEEIANEANISKFYFIKKFKEYLNVSPLHYLTKYRIEKAFTLLQHTDKTVKEISKEVGFSDPNYFRKVFRNIVGTSPSAFRQDNSLKPFTHLITEENTISNNY